MDAELEAIQDRLSWVWSDTVVLNYLDVVGEFYCTDVEAAELEFINTEWKHSTRHPYIKPFLPPLNLEAA